MSTTFTTTTTSRPVIVTATEKVTGPTLIAAVHGGKVRFAKERESGTLRAWPVLVPGSAARKQAEAVMEARAAKQPVEAIAKTLKVSVPTVRRIITAYAFTQEVESLKAAEKAALAKALSAEVASAPKEQKKTEPKAAPKAAPKAEQKPAKAPKESAGARIKRMQAEGKAPVKSATES